MKRTRRPAAQRNGSTRPKVLFILWLKGRNRKGLRKEPGKKLVTGERQTLTAGRRGCVVREMEIRESGPRVRPR
jgi:hypothetical protein